MRRLARFAVGALAATIVLALAGLVYQTLATARDDRLFRPPGRRVDIGGRRLHAVCRGAGQPAVVLEASGLGDWSSWEAVMSPLSALTRVCAYDRAGMGHSDPSGAPATAAALARDLGRLIRALDLGGPPILAGASIGGLTVELHARRHPTAVSGLVLVDALDEHLVRAMPWAWERLERRVRWAEHAARFGVLRLTDPFHLRAVPSTAGAAAAARVYRTRTWTTVVSLLATRAASARQLSEAPALRKDLPLVVLRHGRAGDLVGPGSEALARRVEPTWQVLQARLAHRSGKGELRVAAHSGHLIAHDDPAFVVQAITDVIERVRIP